MSGLTIALSLFVSIWFQVLFHSPHRGSFHLSLTVLVHYRSVSSILPWRVVPPDSDKISRVPSYSGYSLGQSSFRVRDFHPLWCAFPDTSPILSIHYASPTTPTSKLLVWALPRSLAATSGISIDFFSCRYLDVSVPCVRLHKLLYSLMHDLLLPHSEISGSKVFNALPEAYRSLTNVLHRLLLPRYPPYTLSSFFNF